MRRLKFYIGERRNPQTGTYYRAYGQLTKKDAKSKENALYGSIYLTSYESEEEYNNKIELIKSQGNKVYNR